MNSNIKKPTGYGYLTLTILNPVTGQVRVKSAGQSENGLSLFTIPTNNVGSTGINVKLNSEHIASYHHLAVDASRIAFAYHPGTSNYRDFRLGPCTIMMDGEPR